MVYCSGGTPQTVYRFSSCKRRFLESRWVVEVVTTVEFFLLFRNLTTPFPIFLSLLLFLRNSNKFLVSSEIYHIDIRQHANFHQLSMNLTKYQKGVYSLGLRVFNMLPSYIKREFDNSKKFKLILQKFYMKIPFILWMNI